MEVILPVLNEAAALPWVLERIPAGWVPIVVDNGSDDGSADVARAHGATVVTEPARGFGAACFAGLAAATADVVAFMDADASFDPADIVDVAAGVVEGRVDLSLGRRRAERGAWPLHARVANAYLARRISRSTGVALRDIGPLRAARREPLLALGIADRRFGWPLEMVLRAANAGWRIAEVDVTYRPRVGTSKVTGTVRGTARAISDMARVLRVTTDQG